MGIKSARFLLVLVMVFAPPAVGSAAGETPIETNCEWCGQAVDAESAVIVTDWQANKKHTFHSLGCAIQAMSRDYPWSRAKFKSAAGKTLRLTNADGKWSSDPEGAIAAVVERTNSEKPALLPFSSFSELNTFSRGKKKFLRSIVKTVPLSRITAELPPAEYAHNSIADAAGAAESPAPVSRPPGAGSAELFPPDGEGKPSASVNFFGQSGLLTVPNADTLRSRDISAGYAWVLNSNLAHVSAGLGADSRWEAGSAVSGGDLPSAVLLNGKYRLAKPGPWGSRMAVGLLDFADEIGLSVYGVLTKNLSTRLAGKQRDVEISAGVGSGDLLNGPFIGARTPVGERTSVMAEWADVAGERSLNLGVGYRPLRDADVKLGIVDGDIAGSLSVTRKF